jgi:hypothetical protein
MADFNLKKAIFLEKNTSTAVKTPLFGFERKLWR